MLCQSLRSAKNLIKPKFFTLPGEASRPGSTDYAKQATVSSTEKRTLPIFSF